MIADDFSNTHIILVNYLRPLCVCNTEARKTVVRARKAEPESGTPDVGISGLETLSEKDQ